jgi:hypothetical protein
VRNILTQSEPRRVKSTKHDFFRGQRRYGTRKFWKDHFSPILARISGTGEDWDKETAKWILDSAPNSFTSFADQALEDEKVEEI